MFLFWSIAVGIICGAGLAQIAVIVSIVLTLGVMVLSALPVARAPMILVVKRGRPGCGNGGCGRCMLVSQ